MYTCWVYMTMYMCVDKYPALKPLAYSFETVSLTGPELLVLTKLASW